MWTLSAKAEFNYTLLASGYGVSCVAGEFIDLSINVLPRSGTPPALVVAAAGGKEVARVPAPAWASTSGAASVGCSIGLAEFDDISIAPNR